MTSITNWDMSQFTSNLGDLAIDIGLRILYAIIVLIVGLIIINLIGWILRKILTNRKVDPTVIRFSSLLVKAILKVVLALIIISILGIEIAFLGGVFAAFLVAVGLAVAGLFSNLVAGLLLLVLKPIKVGDYINCAGAEGTVVGVELFNTSLNTPQNQRIYVPNNLLITSVLKNVSKEEYLRLDLPVRVTYSENLDRVRKIIGSVLKKETRIVEGTVKLGKIKSDTRLQKLTNVVAGRHQKTFTMPPPVVVITDFNKDDIALSVRVWVKNAEYWAVAGSLKEEFRAAFSKYGVLPPFEAREVYLWNNPTTRAVANGFPDGEEPASPSTPKKTLAKKKKVVRREIEEEEEEEEEDVIEMDEEEEEEEDSDYETKH